MRVGLILCAIALVAACASAGGDGLSIERTDAGWTVLQGDEPVLTFHYSPELTKPFVDPLCTPEGHSVTLNSPPDHVHHHALMFAWGNVRPTSEPEDYHLVFWGEAGDPHTIGRIVPDPDREPIVEATDDAARIVVFNKWLRNSDDLLVLTERCELVYEDGILTWITEQRAEVDLVIGPTPGRDVSYYGLGIRVPHDMDRGMFVDSNGNRDVAGVHGDDAAWCAYGSTVTPARGFAMFDHADNPRHPTGWFAMNDAFGYLTASLVAHEPYPVLEQGDTLRLCYGILAFDGELDADLIDDRYEDWLELTE